MLHKFKKAFKIFSKVCIPFSSYSKLLNELARPLSEICSVSLMQPCYRDRGFKFSEADWLSVDHDVITAWYKGSNK